jgi:hypothetical protein
MQLLLQLVAFVGGSDTGGGGDGRNFLAAGSVLLDEPRKAFIELKIEN